MASLDTVLRQLVRTDREFEQALTLPGFVYHDRDVYRHEVEHLFRKQWVCAGHISAFARVGAYRTLEIGGDSIVITRAADGQLHALHNVCRHRGTRVVRDAHGSCKHFTCPYHSWAYALDGTLIAAPGMDASSGFKREDYPLRALAVATLHGFVFVCQDPAAAPLAERFADFPDLSVHALATLVPGAAHEYTVDSNWKLIGENYNECYHCASAHPQLHRLSADANLDGFDHRGKHFTGGPMTIKSPYQSMTMDGYTKRALLPGMDQHQPPLTLYFHLFPNLLLSIAPDYAMAHYLWPHSAERVHIVTEWLFTPAQMAAAEFDPDDAVAFWDTTNRQDWALCENAFLGLQSGAHRPGRYQSTERCVHDFDRWYTRSIRRTGAA